MKDQLIVLCEALRLAQLELDCYQDSMCRGSAGWTVSRLNSLLNDPAIKTAMSILQGETASPPLAPSEHENTIPARTYSRF